MTEEQQNPLVVRVFDRIKETMFGAIEVKSRSIISDLQSIQDILRPSLTQLAHKHNKPYVEPTLETDFLQRWEETENKGDLIIQIGTKYEQMLVSVPERDKWRL